MRYFLAIPILGCAATSPVLEHRVAEPAPPPALVWTDADDDPDGRRCTTSEVREAPIGAGISFGGQSFACTFGPSPRDDLAAKVQINPLLRACLSTVDQTSFAEVELGVAATGKVARAAVQEWSGDAGILRCIPVLLTLASSPADCRWRTTVTIATTVLTSSR